MSSLLIREAPVHNFPCQSLPSLYVNRRLQQVYDSVEDIDIYSGGVTESSDAGINVGPTFACLIKQTFEDLKFGDRFWYENTDDSATSFTSDQV